MALPDYKKALDKMTFKSLSISYEYLGLTKKTGFSIVHRYYDVSFSCSGVHFSLR